MSILLSEEYTQEPQASPIQIELLAKMATEDCRSIYIANELEVWRHEAEVYPLWYRTNMTERLKVIDSLVLCRLAFFDFIIDGGRVTLSFARLCLTAEGVNYAMSLPEVRARLESKSKEAEAMPEVQDAASDSAALSV